MLRVFFTSKIGKNILANIVRDAGIALNELEPINKREKALCNLKKNADNLII